MASYLLVLTGVALIIAFGVGVSSYLNSRGAIPQRSFGRISRASACVAQSMDDDDDGFRIATGVLTDATSRYARNFLFVAAGAFLFIVLFVTMLLH